jgi:hypothetical protein
MTQREIANKGPVICAVCVRMYVCLRSFEKAISLSPWYVIVVHWTWVYIRMYARLLDGLLDENTPCWGFEQTEDQNV